MTAHVDFSYSLISSQDVVAPIWRNDGEALWGRLIELGGVAGLHTDSECLLLKDLCTSGIADDAFLGLVDKEIHVMPFLNVLLPACAVLLLSGFLSTILIKIVVHTCVIVWKLKLCGNHMQADK